MSDFASAFDRSFAIQRAISLAISETHSFTITAADVARHLGEEAAMLHRSELISAIVIAAKHAGTPIAICDTHDF